jgi:deazaflavin-dependent oxidoreductase (nitroreductase family)
MMAATAPISPAKRRQRTLMRALWRVMNPVAARLAGIAPWWVVLETTGRRSGRPRRTPLARGPIEGETAWLLAVHGRSAAWVRNLEAEPQVSLRVGRRWHTGRATVNELDPERLRSFSLYARSGPAAIGIEPVAVAIRSPSLRAGENRPMRIEKSIEIARPLDAVWELAADPRNDPRWCEKVASVEQVEGTGPGSGARYRVMHRPLPVKPAQELQVSVEGFEPPRRLRLREEDEDGVFDVAYVLEPLGPAATRISQVDEIEWKIPRFQRPIARLTVGRHIGRQLRTLKRLLEADAGDDSY